MCRNCALRSHYTEAGTIDSNGPMCKMRVVCALIDLFQARLSRTNLVEISWICIEVIPVFVFSSAYSVGNNRNISLLNRFWNNIPQLISSITCFLHKVRKMIVTIQIYSILNKSTKNRLIFVCGINNISFRVILFHIYISQVYRVRKVAVEIVDTSGGYSLASEPENPSSLSGHFMCPLWWAKWHWNMFCPVLHSFVPFNIIQPVLQVHSRAV
jgi:hypothetical protein